MCECFKTVFKLMKIENHMFSHFIAHFDCRRLLLNKMIMMWHKVQVKSILIISDSKTAELTGGKRGQGRDQRIEMYLHELRKCTNQSQVQIQLQNLQINFHI